MIGKMLKTFALAIVVAMVNIVVFAANVAKVGDTEYATISAAINAAGEGDTVVLLSNVDVSGYFVYNKNYTIDGNGYTIKCVSSNSNYPNYFVNVNGYSQTFKNVTIDANEKVPYAMQCIENGSVLTLDNVTVKGGKSMKTKGKNDSYSKSRLGYGIHINNGSVVAKDLKVSNCTVLPVYLDGSSSKFNLSGDNCSLDVVGTSGSVAEFATTARGYCAYEVQASYKFMGFINQTKTCYVISAMPWNKVVDQVGNFAEITVTSAIVKLLGNVTLVETFTSSDTKLTIDGNGKTVTGTIKFTSSPSAIKNVVLGDGSTLDFTGSTSHGFSNVSVAANTGINILLPTSVNITSYSLPVSLGVDAYALISVGDKKYVAKNGSIAPAESAAQVGETKYSTLQAAVNAANGAIIHLLKDVALTSAVAIPAGTTVTLNLAGRIVTVSGANYAIVNNGNLTIVDEALVAVSAAEASISDDDDFFYIMSAVGGVARSGSVGGCIAGVQNNGTFTLESGKVVSASSEVPAIDNTASGTVFIAGGNVQGKLQSVVPEKLTVTGGSFSADSNVSDYLGGDQGLDSNGSVVNYVAYIGDSKYQTLEAAFGAATEFDVVKILDGNADVSSAASYVKAGLFPISNGDGTFTVRQMPNATVEKLPAFTLDPARGEYYVWDGSSTSKGSEGDIARPLDVVMNFIANDDGKAAANATGFADWKCDFYLTFSGMAGSSIKTDQCYLAGNYGGWGWIVIPADGAVVGNGAVIPVVSVFDSNITYRQICEDVKKFTAAIHMDDAILDANPDLKIKLELKMTNNKDCSQELVVGSYTYTVNDLKGLSNPEVLVADDISDAEKIKENVANALSSAYQTADGNFTVTIKDKGEAFVTVDVSPINGYSVPAEGLAMTFPAESVADGESAIIVHKHEGKAYVSTGVVEYGFVKYNNTLGFSEFTVGDSTALSEAFASGGEVVLLCDVSASFARIENVRLTTNVAGGVTISNTSTEDIWFAFNNVTVGSGVTLVMPNVLITTSTNVIEGILITGTEGSTGATYYQRTDAKTTVQNGGKIVVNGDVVLRYNSNDRAGIYVYGDNDATTVEFSTTGYIGAYSGAFYVKDAVVSTGTDLRLDYYDLKNGVVKGEEDDKYAPITAEFINSTVNVAGQLRLYKDANMTLTKSNVHAGTLQVRAAATPIVKVDAESSLTADTVENVTGALVNAVRDENGRVTFNVMQAKIGSVGYSTLQDAIAAAQVGDTVTLLSDVKLTGKLTIAKAITIDGNGYSIIADETAVWYTVSGKFNIKNYTHLIGVNSGNVTLKDIILDCNDNAAGINIYCAQNIVFDNVSIINATKGTAGITVNGSTLTAKNKLTVLGNSVALDISNGSGVTSTLGVTVEAGTVFDLGNKTVKFASVASNNLAGAVKEDGTPYFAAMDNAYFYTEAQIESRTTAFSNGLTLLADLKLTKSITVNGPLDLCGKNLTFASDDVKVTLSMNAKIKGAASDNLRNNVAVASGCVLFYGNGIYMAVTPVAQIGDVKYGSLADAVSAVEDNGTITLLGNVTITEVTRTHNSGTWYDGIYYVGDKSFTIDFAGFTVTHDGSVNDYLLNFKNAGSKANTITLKNGTADAGTAAYCALCTSSTQENQLTINLEGMKLINNISNGSVAKIRGGVIVNVKDDTEITGENSYLGIECIASTVNIYDGAEIYMNGTSSYNGCLAGVGSGGVVNVYGGYGKGAKGGFIAMTSGGTINISGGEWIANTDGSVGDNSNYYVLTAQNNKNESGWTGASIINVAGGTFRGGMDAWVLNNVVGEKVELNISGGNFNANPARFVVAGYLVSETSGIYTVAKAVAKIGDVTYKTLQAAVNAVQNGETITLVADITEDVTLTEKTGLYYTIDGNGKKMEGTITISSLSDTNDNRRITIKNINFVTTTGRDFITSTATNHYPRITVEGCTFTGTGNADTVAIRLKSSHSVIIKDCFGTGLHSFLQNTSGWNLTVENVTVTDSKSGLALGTVQGVTVKGCNIDVAGYGVRMDAQYNNNATLESNTVKAFIPVVVRKASVDSNITVKGDNTMTATNTDGIWFAIGTSEYETNGTMPTAATGKVRVSVNDAGLNKAGVYGAYKEGSNSPAYTAKDDNGNVRVWGEGGGNATYSYVLKLFSGETLIATSTLNNVGGILNGNVFVTWAFFYPASNDEYWTTVWAEGHPNSAAQPTKVELWIDGVMVSSTPAQMNGPDNLNPIVWRELGGVAVGDLEGEGTEAAPYLIKNLAELKYFRDSVKAGNNYAGKYVALAADIDLGNEDWAPIGFFTDNKDASDDKPFKGVFDGQGKTISNLKIDKPEMNAVGFFAYAESAFIKNLNVVNAEITGYSQVAAIVGRPYSGCSISNCHVSGTIAITAKYAYAGGIAGYGYLVVENCSVVGADTKGTITAVDRNAVGGITAWLLEGVSKMTNCHVKNMALTGWTNVGGLTGFLHYNGVIDGCSVENVVLTKTRENGHPGIGWAAGGWSYNASKPAIVKNSTFKNITRNGQAVYISSADVMFGSEYAGNTNKSLTVANNTLEAVEDNLWLIVSNYEDLVSALARSDAKVRLANHITAAATQDSGYGKAGIVLNAGNILDGAGYTLKITGAGATWDCAIAMNGGEVRNLTIDGAMRGVFMPGANGDVVIDNCVFQNVVYTFNSDAGSKDYAVTIKNSTLNGWTSFSNVHKSVDFVDCSFGEGSGYAYCRPYQATTFTGCTFAEGYEFDTAQTAANALSFNNCTYAGNAVSAKDSAELFSVKGEVLINGTSVNFASAVAKIGSAYYYTLTDAVAAAQAGDTIVLLADIEATSYIALGKSVTINGNGHKVTSSATRVFRVTTSNVEVILTDVNMVSTAVRVGQNDVRGISVDASLNGVKLTLNNCSVDFTDASACDWSYAVNIAGSGTGHALTVNGGTYEGANVINVNGTRNNIIVKDATLTSLYPINEAYYGAAIYVAQDTNSSIEATGNTFNGGNAVGINAGYTPVTESNNTDNMTRVVAKIGTALYTDLRTAMTSAKAGETVVMIADVDLSGKEWEPVSFAGKFNGNGKTIRNLTINKPGVSNVGFISSLNSTFENVTFENPTVTGGENTGVVAGCAGGSSALAQDITITGTIKVETTHSGYARAAAIVGGWGYGNYKNITVDGIDAAVSYIKHTGGGDGRYVAGIVGHADEVQSFENCIVKNITISGGWLCGGITGPGPGSATVSGCAVENIKMNADYSGGMFGWYYGSGAVENSSVKNVEFTAGGSRNGAIGGYGVNAEANLSNVTFENVTNFEGKPLLEHVASVNGVYYTSLKSAVTAAQAGDTITMIADEVLAVTVTIAADKTITLDLNGKTIDGTGKVRIAVMSYGNLTIKDSVGNGVVKAGTGTAGNCINICGGSFTLESGNIYSLNNAILIDEQAAEVTIMGGKITAEPSTRNSAAFYISSTSDTVLNITGGEIVGYNGILLWNNTTLNITGGSIEAKGSVAIQGNGSKDNTVISISGDAELFGYYAAIYHPQGGKLSISENAKLTGWTGVVVKGGDVTISGGTITGTGAANAYAPASSGFVDTGDALYVEHYDNSANSENYGTPVVKVTGGTFISTNGKAVASYKNPNNNVEALDDFITGGTFSTDVTELCALGYYSWNDNSAYTVVKPSVWMVNGAASNENIVNDIDSKVVGAVTISKDGDKYVANAACVFKVLAVDTVNPENSPYSLTDGNGNTLKLRTGVQVRAKYVDSLTNDTTKIFKLVIEVSR